MLLLLLLPQVMLCQLPAVQCIGWMRLLVAWWCLHAPSLQHSG
jgi:hypothetical protein